MDIPQTSAPQQRVDRFRTTGIKMADNRAKMMKRKGKMKTRMIKVGYHLSNNFGLGTLVSYFLI